MTSFGPPIDVARSTLLQPLVITSYNDKKFRFLCVQLPRVVKMEVDQEGVDDMVELAEISEKAIAANLYVRLKKEKIYVSAVTWFTLSNS